MASNLAKMTKKVGEEDPRRIVHSVKVGLAITLASLFYSFGPLYDGFGASSIWTIITVVVVLEFSVGAIASFVRFFPCMKARYDYGAMIFILTFTMVAVSSLRDDEILKLAFDRLLTILIGTLISFIISLFVWPIWIGTDLHHLIATNIENLGIFVQDFGGEYFRVPREEGYDKARMQRYRSILTSKQSEESMANLARWEPRRFRHPWAQYLKIGGFARDCSYRLQVLHGYLDTGDLSPLQMQGEFQEECLKMCNELGKILHQLALAIKKMTTPTSADPHIQKARPAAEKLNSLLRMGKFEGLEMVQAATFVLLLLDCFSCIEKMADSILELATLAKFKAVAVQSTVAPLAQHRDMLHV